MGRSMPSRGKASPLLDRPEPPLLAAQPELPRELERDEVAALLQASDEPTRLVVLLLLSGLTTEEAIAARVGDVDLERGVLRIRGSETREVSDWRRAARGARGARDKRSVGPAGRSSSSDRRRERASTRRSCAQRTTPDSRILPTSMRLACDTPMSRTSSVRASASPISLRLSANCRPSSLAPTRVTRRRDLGFHAGESKRSYPGARASIAG